MKKYIVEFLGTMFLMFIILATGNYLSIGAALALAIILGHGSYNPAISLALMYMGNLPTKDLIPCIVSQIAGAIVAVHAYYVYKSRF